jgi:hypothetical protein
VVYNSYNLYHAYIISLNNHDCFDIEEIRYSWNYDCMRNIVPLDRHLELGFITIVQHLWESC